MEKDLTDEQRFALDFLRTRDTPWTYATNPEYAELEKLGLAERNPTEDMPKWRLSLAGMVAWQSDPVIREHARLRANGLARGCFYTTRTWVTGHVG